MSDSCADLAGAAAVTLVLLLGIDVSGSGQAAAKAVDPPAVSPVRPLAQEKPPQSQPLGAPIARQSGVILRVPSVAFDYGPLPSPSLGVGLGAGMRLQSWRVLFEGRLYSKQAVTIPSSVDGLGVEVRRASAELRTCRGWRSNDLEIAPCVGLVLETLSARAFGTGVSPQTRAAVWAAPAIGVNGYWHVSRSVAVFGQFDGRFELSRPHIVIDGVGDVTQLGPVAGSAVLGLEWTT